MQSDDSTVDNNMSEDGIGTAPIACEPCRHKKCKVGVVFPRLTVQPSELHACPEVTDDRIHSGSVIASCKDRGLCA